MLEAIKLSKSYNGATALDSLDFKIEPGEVFCLLGANGAGKTTTINLFLNFIEPTSGAAMIKGLDVTKEPLETKRYIAYIPEQVMLLRTCRGWRIWNTSRHWPGTKSIRVISCWVSSKRWDCGAKWRTTAYRHTQRACGGRMGSPSRWRRKPKRCCWTNRLPALIRKRRMNSRRY